MGVKVRFSGGKVNFSGEKTPFSLKDATAFSAEIITHFETPIGAENDIFT